MNVEILGTVQDGGVPHLGCECQVCEAARKDRDRVKYATSLLLRENGTNHTVRYLIDATPDIRCQITGDYLDGVFIPHDDLGHVTGLLYFGEEGSDTDSLNVYSSERVKNFLMKNDPYRFLIDRGNIEVHEVADGDSIDIQGGEIETRRFSHHVSEETSGYLIKGGEKTLFYLSDIHRWNEEILELIEESDIAVIDGTFWSRDEIERYEEVPHPPIRESMDEMEEFDTDIYFIHMNHTNPVLIEDSDERAELEERGFQVAERGDEFEL